MKCLLSIGFASFPPLNWSLWVLHNKDPAVYDMVQIGVCSRCAHHGAINWEGLCPSCAMDEAYEHGPTPEQAKRWFKVA